MNIEIRKENKQLISIILNI